MIWCCFVDRIVLLRRASLNDRQSAPSATPILPFDISSLHTRASNRTIAEHRAAGSEMGTAHQRALTRNGGREGQEQSALAAAKSEDAVMTVECGGVVVLGIDKEGIGCDLGSISALDRVPQEGTANPLLVDSESSEARNRYCGVAWQALGLLLRKVGKKHTAHGERALANDGGFLIDRDGTGADAPPYILARPSLKISVKRAHAASEPGTLVMCCKALNDERAVWGQAIRLRWRSRARSIAGASGLGLMSASAMRWCSATKRWMTLASSITRAAASGAAVTTKSVRLRPSISAARLSNKWISVWSNA